MSNVLLGATGSVAAIRAPLLAEQLRSAGHEVKLAATRAATFFFDPAEIAPLTTDGVARRNPHAVILDEDEWPGIERGERFRMGDPVLHIELRRWADVFVVAPLDANTLAKMACGLADNCLTCVWRAWDLSRPVVLAPAMNTLMWEHPLTAEHLRKVAELIFRGANPGQDLLPSTAQEVLELDDLIGWINDQTSHLRIVPPQQKRLACGDIGVGGLAEVADVVNAVNAVCPK